MRARTNGWRLLVAASAVSATALMAACGGTGGRDGAHASASTRPAGLSSHTSSPTADSPTPTPSTAVTPGPSGANVLTRQELNHVLLGEHELAGYDIQYVGEKDGPGRLVDSSRLPRVTPAVCQPIYEAAMGLSAYRYSAAVTESATPTSSQNHQMVMFSLISYTTTTAPKVLNDLRTALPACATSTIHPSAGAPSDSSDFSHPGDVSSPRLGDEALSFRMTEVHPADELSGPFSLDMLVLLVRKGPTVAVFTTKNDHAPGQPATMPSTVVNAQLAKLR
jgi:hypothetical protein